MRLLLEQFEAHQKTGLRLLRQNQPQEARKHLLKAAEFLFKVAEKSEGDLRQKRIEKARKLLQLAKSLSPERTRSAGTKSEEKEAQASLAPLSPSELTFADVAGLEDVKEAILLRVVYPLRYPEKASRYGITPGGGILLYGPPGTGKTLLAKATAGELKRKFFAIYPSDILSKYVGEAEKNCAEIFRQCREEPGSVLFIDEVEALLPQRSAENQSPVMQRLVPQILSELDGVKTNLGSLLLLAATNEPWSLDPAVLRPGRFDEKIYIGLPDFATRLALLKLHLKNCPLDPHLDFEALAHQLRRYSGADIRFICQKTAQTAFLSTLYDEEEPPLVLQDFLQVILETPPSITHEQLTRFQEYSEKMGLISNARRKNGENEDLA